MCWHWQACSSAWVQERELRRQARWSAGTPYSRKKISLGYTSSPTGGRQQCRHSARISIVLWLYISRKQADILLSMNPSAMQNVRMDLHASPEPGSPSSRGASNGSGTILLVRRPCFGCTHTPDFQRTLMSPHASMGYVIVVLSALRQVESSRTLAHLSEAPIAGLDRPFSALGSMGLWRALMPIWSAIRGPAICLCCGLRWGQQWLRVGDVIRVGTLCCVMRIHS